MIRSADVNTTSSVLVGLTFQELLQVAHSRLKGPPESTQPRCIHVERYRTHPDAFCCCAMIYAAHKRRLIVSLGVGDYKRLRATPGRSPAPFCIPTTFLSATRIKGYRWDWGYSEGQNRHEEVPVGDRVVPVPWARLAVRLR